MELVRTCLAFTSCNSNVSPSAQAKGILAGLAYLHQREIIHGRVHRVSGLPPSWRPSDDSTSPQGNVLVDDNGIAMLCDAKYDLVMFSENEYCSLTSKCWWMPHERLIVDDDATGSCPVAPPSMSADIYGAALTVAQVDLPFIMVIHSILIPASMTDVDTAAPILWDARRVRAHWDTPQAQDWPAGAIRSA